MRANKSEKKERGYESLFIRDSDKIARYGKTVYISSEHHKRISQIVHVIGKGNMSIFSYIDNVLTHHFETFKEEITECYENKRVKHIF